MFDCIPSTWGIKQPSNVYQTLDGLTPNNFTPRIDGEKGKFTMKNPKLNMFGAMDSVPENAGKVKGFEQVKRDFETALASGGDYSKSIMDLSAAIAFSVVRKCLDPQRKTATDRGAVSDSGQNPAMLDLRRGIAADVKLLDNTREAADKATQATLNQDGDPVTVTADKDAKAALNALIGETLSDGIDLIQTAACALLEQAADHAGGPGWLDRPYTHKRLTKTVYTRMDTPPEYKDVETAPIQEVYREVRRAVQGSRAMQTDPRNGYSYIAELTEDGAETIYRRLQKYANLGGYACNGKPSDYTPGAPTGYGTGDGLYTTDEQTAREKAAIVEALDLTPRQREVLEYRLRGVPHAEIGKALNVTEQAVYNTVYRLQDKMYTIGKFPKGWTPESREGAADKAVAVVKMDTEGHIIARYKSASAASATTGINAGNIRMVANGKRSTAGGFRWALDK